MSTATPAQRITRAVQDDDLDYARYIAGTLKAVELRQVVLELAAKAPIERVHVDLNDVFDAAAARFGVNREDVLSANRRQEIVKARQVSCYAAHLLGYSQSHIARALSRDHTTIWHAVTRVGEVSGMRAVAQEIARELGWDRNALEAVG